MLFNDYPFLLVFLPAALLIYRACRSVSAVADLDAGAAVAGVLRLSAIRRSSLLLVLSILINWLAALAYAGPKMSARSSRRRSSPISPCSRCSNTPTFLATISASCSAGRCRCSISRCRSASRSSPSTTSCIWSICARARRRSIRSTATRSTSRFSRRRSPGPLARWSEVMRPVRPPGLCAGLAARILPRHLLHRDRPVREDLSRRPDRRASSIRSMRRRRSAR